MRFPNNGQWVAPGKHDSPRSHLIYYWASGNRSGLFGMCKDLLPGPVLLEGVLR